MFTESCYGCKAMRNPVEIHNPLEFIDEILRAPKCILCSYYVKIIPT